MEHAGVEVDRAADARRDFHRGNYHVVSFALNSCGVQLDEGVAPAM